MTEAVQDRRRMWRNVAVLILAQSVLGAQLPMLFITAGLAGQTLAPNPCLATLPISTMILGSTLFLLLGAGPSAIGLALGLLVQGLFFAPSDLPQYGMNLTTLLVPLFALHEVARRVIAPGTPYVDLRYAQVMQMSLIYQGGIVAWVALWALYGQGFGATAAIASFGLAYMSVVLLEPLVDLAVLAGAKALRGRLPEALVARRLYAA